ncbi:hypothetical protein [Sodalis sp. RH16]|uniref:hypothetical protein n=1 Tax=unclassified Sodalis (in: enterobacteria) TaxID=2636512 RepID=UPI0039B45DE3
MSITFYEILPSFFFTVRVNAHIGAELAVKSGIAPSKSPPFSQDAKPLTFTS